MSYPATYLEEKWFHEINTPFEQQVNETSGVEEEHMIMSSIGSSRDFTSSQESG